MLYLYICYMLDKLVDRNSSMISKIISIPSCPNERFKFIRDKESYDEVVNAWTIIFMLS